MNVLRNVGLIAIGMLLVLGLLAGVGGVLADGPPGGLSGPGGMPVMGDEHMGSMEGGRMFRAHHPTIDFEGVMGRQGGMAAMRQGMHGEPMPDACLEMMDDPEMMGHMMQMMHGSEPMSAAECQEWMTDYEVPVEMQAECLEHMAEHHGP